MTNTNTANKTALEIIVTPNTCESFGWQGRLVDFASAVEGFFASRGFAAECVTSYVLRSSLVSALESVDLDASALADYLSEVCWNGEHPDFA